MKNCYSKSINREKLQAGFSLIELMIVILLLSVIMGSVFGQIDLVQKRFRSEQSKLEVVQTAREFMDQMIRDIHQNAFPNVRMYQIGPGTSVLGGNLADYYSTSANNAVGIVFISPTSVRFEGDVAGDGNVYAVAYTLFPASANPGDESCPCLRRSQVFKADGVAPIAQATDYRTQVENLSTTSSNVFSAFAQDGSPVVVTAGLTRTGFNPNDLNDSVNKIFTIQIKLNVQGARSDIGTTQRPQVFLTATAQINN